MPMASLRALIGHGKRLRPAFCHWGFVGAGGDPDDQRVVDAGAALELLHTFALVHDDIMDDSTRRHGVACLHVDFADRHAARGWHGEARRFGDGAAILIGDLAFVYADQLLRRASQDALDVFTELRLEVNVGQYLDLVGTATDDATAEQARTIAVYKSGKYTIERPCTWARRWPAGSTIWPGLHRLRGPAGRGVPAAGRPARRLRRQRPAGQRGGRGHPDGKPTALAGRGRADRRRAALLDARSAAPDLTASSRRRPGVLDRHRGRGPGRADGRSADRRPSPPSPRHP